MPEQSRSEIGSSILEVLEQSFIQDQKDDEGCAWNYLYCFPHSSI